MKYDWKLPTVWASQHRPWVFFYFFHSHRLCWDRNFSTRRETHVCYVSNIPKKHTYLSNGLERFLGSKWTDEVNVRDFIQNNYTQYDDDESFLAAPTSATHLLWGTPSKASEGRARKGRCARMRN